MVRAKVMPRRSCTSRVKRAGGGDGPVSAIMMRGGEGREILCRRAERSAVRVQRTTPRAREVYGVGCGDGVLKIHGILAQHAPSGADR